MTPWLPQKNFLKIGTFRPLIVNLKNRSCSQKTTFFSHFSGRACLHTGILSGPPGHLLYSLPKILDLIVTLIIESEQDITCDSNRTYQKGLPFNSEKYLNPVSSLSSLFSPSALLTRRYTSKNSPFLKSLVLKTLRPVKVKEQTLWKIISEKSMNFESNTEMVFQWFFQS